MAQLTVLAQLAGDVEQVNRSFCVSFRAGNWSDADKRYAYLLKLQSEFHGHRTQIAREVQGTFDHLKLDAKLEAYHDIVSAITLDRKTRRNVPDADTLRRLNMARLSYLDKTTRFLDELFSTDCPSSRNLSAVVETLQSYYNAQVARPLARNLQAHRETAVAGNGRRGVRFATQVARNFTARRPENLSSAVSSGQLRMLDVQIRSKLKEEGPYFFMWRGDGAYCSEPPSMTALDAFLAGYDPARDRGDPLDPNGGEFPAAMVSRLRIYSEFCRRSERLIRVRAWLLRSPPDDPRRGSLDAEAQAQAERIASLLGELHDLYESMPYKYDDNAVGGPLGPKRAFVASRFASIAAAVNFTSTHGTISFGRSGQVLTSMDAGSSYEFRELKGHPRNDLVRARIAARLADRIAAAGGMPEMALAIRQIVLDDRDRGAVSFSWTRVAGLKALKLQFEGGRSLLAFRTQATVKESGPDSAPQPAMRIMYFGPYSDADRDPARRVVLAMARGREGVSSWDEYWRDGRRLRFRRSARITQLGSLYDHRVAATYTMELEFRNDSNGQWSGYTYWESTQDESDPRASVANQWQANPGIVLRIAGGVVHGFFKVMHSAGYGITQKWAALGSPAQIDAALNALANRVSYSWWKRGAAISEMNSVFSQNPGTRARLDSLALSGGRCDPNGPLLKFLNQAGVIGRGRGGLYDRLCGANHVPLTDEERIEYLLSGKYFGTAGMQRQVVTILANEGLSVGGAGAALLTFGPEVAANIMLGVQAVRVLQLLGTIQAVNAVAGGSALTWRLTTAGQTLLTGVLTEVSVETAEPMLRDIGKVVSLGYNSVTGRGRYTSKQRQQNVVAVIDVLSLVAGIAALPRASIPPKQLQAIWLARQMYPQADWGALLQAYLMKAPETNYAMRSNIWRCFRSALKRQGIDIGAYPEYAENVWGARPKAPAGPSPSRTVLALPEPAASGPGTGLEPAPAAPRSVALAHRPSVSAAPAPLSRVPVLPAGALSASRPPPTALVMNAAVEMVARNPESPANTGRPDGYSGYPTGEKINWLRTHDASFREAFPEQPSADLVAGIDRVHRADNDFDPSTGRLTRRALRKKAAGLRRLGLNPTQVRLLVENWVVGERPTLAAFKPLYSSKREAWPGLPEVRPHVEEPSARHASQDPQVQAYWERDSRSPLGRPDNHGLDLILPETVVFHGSGTPGIKVADLEAADAESERSGAASWTLGRGMYFTPDEAAAEQYAKYSGKRGGTPTVYEATISGKFLDLRRNANVWTILSEFAKEKLVPWARTLQKEDTFLSRALYEQVIAAINTINDPAHAGYNNGWRGIINNRADLFADFLKEKGYVGAIGLTTGERGFAPGVMADIVVVEPEKLKLRIAGEEPGAEKPEEPPRSTEPQRFSRASPEQLARSLHEASRSNQVERSARPKDQAAVQADFERYAGAAAPDLALPKLNEQGHPEWVEPEPRARLEGLLLRYIKDKKLAPESAAKLGERYVGYLYTSGFLDYVLDWRTGHEKYSRLPADRTTEIDNEGILLRLDGTETLYLAPPSQKSGSTNSFVQIVRRPDGRVEIRRHQPGPRGGVAVSVLSDGETVDLWMDPEAGFRLARAGPSGHPGLDYVRLRVSSRGIAIASTSSAGARTSRGPVPMEWAQPGEDWVYHGGSFDEDIVVRTDDPWLRKLAGAFKATDEFKKHHDDPKILSTMVSWIRSRIQGGPAGYAFSNKARQIETDVPAGLIACMRSGVCRHKSLLTKVLLDALRLPEVRDVRLVSGPSHLFLVVDWDGALYVLDSAQRDEAIPLLAPNAKYYAGTDSKGGKIYYRYRDAWERQGHDRIIAPYAAASEPPPQIPSELHGAWNWVVNEVFVGLSNEKQEQFLHFFHDSTINELRPDILREINGAHHMFDGQPGRDGKPAGRGNLTRRQILVLGRRLNRFFQKNGRTVKDAREITRFLMDEGFCGAEPEPQEGGRPSGTQAELNRLLEPLVRKLEGRQRAIKEEEGSIERERTVLEDSHAGEAERRKAEQAWSEHSLKRLLAISEEAPWARGEAARKLGTLLRILSATPDPADYTLPRGLNWLQRRSYALGAEIEATGTVKRGEFVRGTSVSGVLRILMEGGLGPSSDPAYNVHGTGVYALVYDGKMPSNHAGKSGSSPPAFLRFVDATARDSNGGLPMLPGTAAPGTTVLIDYPKGRSEVPLDEIEVFIPGQKRWVRLSELRRLLLQKQPAPSPSGPSDDASPRRSAAPNRGRPFTSPDVESANADNQRGSPQSRAPPVLTQTGDTPATSGLLPPDIARPVIIEEHGSYWRLYSVNPRSGARVSLGSAHVEGGAFTLGISAPDSQHGLPEKGWTKAILSACLEKWRELHGGWPDDLPGSLTLSNLEAFRASYRRIRASEPDLSLRQAAVEAARQTPFGAARSALGWTQISVTFVWKLRPRGVEKLDYIPEGKRMPDEIEVHARRPGGMKPAAG